MSKKNLIVLKNEVNQKTKDLLNHLREYINDLEEKGLSIASIGVAVRYANQDDAVTFAGEDLGGLSGAVNTLSYRLSKHINAQTGEEEDYIVE